MGSIKDEVLLLDNRTVAIAILIAVVLLSLTLFMCSSLIPTEPSSYKIPKELKHCKLYEIQNEKTGHFYPVLDCTN
jgi:hypothetical protein